MTEYCLHDPIEDYTIDVFNIYFNYLINKDDTYLKDYNLTIFENMKLFFNKYVSVNTNQEINTQTNHNASEDVNTNIFSFCHDLEIYGYLYYQTDNVYIEIINKNPEYIDAYIYKCYLAKKDNLILYNPVNGNYYCKNVNLDFMLFPNIELKTIL